MLGAMLVLAACARRYDGTGVVIAVAPQQHLVTISHDAIPGYMDPMVMPFSVRDAALLNEIQPGDRVQFRLVVTRSESHLDRLDVLSAARTDAGLLRSPAIPTLIGIGEKMPNFTLRDQLDRPISLEDLAGQVVIVTFIYTRCPLPDYCPRMMLNFREIKERFEPLLGRELTLLTITFDPKYDTPEIMARYGRAFGSDGPGWHLLTGPSEEIQRVTEAFGIEFWPEEGMFTHTLQTAVLDRQGRLYGTLEGKEYSVQQLADLVSAALSRPTH